MNMPDENLSCASCAFAAELSDGKILCTQQSRSEKLVFITWDTPICEKFVDLADMYSALLADDEEEEETEASEEEMDDAEEEPNGTDDEEDEDDDDDDDDDDDIEDEDEEDDNKAAKEIEEIEDEAAESPEEDEDPAEALNEAAKEVLGDELEEVAKQPSPTQQKSA